MKTFLDVCAVLFVLLVLPVTVLNVAAGVYVSHEQHQIEDRQDVLEAEVEAARYALRATLIEYMVLSDSLEMCKAAAAQQRWQYLEDCDD